MTIDSDIIHHLNRVLTNQLTGINQYFLHARILKHKGVMKLADYEYRASIVKMKYADKLVERILLIGGIPNMQDVEPLLIGDTIDALLTCDLKLEGSAQTQLKDAIALSLEKADQATVDVLQHVLESQEEHLQFIQSQLKLIDTMGLTAYLQTQV